MVFIVAKWDVIILIKKNMYMKKEKGAEILMKKKKKYINKRFTDFWNVCMYVDRLQWKKRERGESHRN